MALSENLEKVFQNIQNLQIQPTETNIMLLADCMLNLKKIYNSLPAEPEVVQEGEERENVGDE